MVRTAYQEFRQVGGLLVSKKGSRLHGVGDGALTQGPKPQIGVPVCACQARMPFVDDSHAQVGRLDSVWKAIQITFRDVRNGLSGYHRLLDASPRSSR